MIQLKKAIKDRTHSEMSKMDRLFYERMTSSIPIDSMPLNKNFISVESRLQSFEKYEHKLNEDPKELAEAGLFCIKGSDFIFCFNCGHTSIITKDGKVRSNTIYHSKLCNIIPHPDLKIVTELKKDAPRDANSKLFQPGRGIENNDVPPIISNEDTKRKDKDEHIKNCFQKEDSDIETKAENDVEKENMEKEDAVKNEVVDDEEIFDDDPEGVFWDCKLCGEDEDIKLINIPCKHRTYCVFCIQNVKECCFCNKEIISFLPVYF